jgi:hypothetical protein
MTRCRVSTGDSRSHLPIRSWQQNRRAMAARCWPVKAEVLVRSRGLAVQ